MAPAKDQASLFRCMVLDWETENREEPFPGAARCSPTGPAWSATAGFEQVEEFAGASYVPWVTRGVKPTR